MGKIYKYSLHKKTQFSLPINNTNPKDPMIIFKPLPLFLTAFLILAHINQVLCYKNFEFQTFRDGVDDDQFKRNTSYIVSSAIQVTPDLSVSSIVNKSGKIVNKNPLRLYSDDNRASLTSFNTTFVINITPRTSPSGGEGLAFVIAGDPSLPDKSEGQWLGIVNEASNGTKRASIVAIEFDTRKSFPEDIDDNHVGLDVNTVYSIKQVPLMEHGVNLTAGGEKGTDVHVHVSYDGKVISVFVSMTEEFPDGPIISETLDLSKYLPEKVYVGFTGSTSNYTELNCVKSWVFYADEVKTRSSNLYILVAVPIAALTLICATVWLLYWYRKHRIEVEEDDAYPRIEDQITGSSTAPKKFKFKELRRATGNFDERYKLGSGGFGTVYKGLLLNREVAVKRISKDSRQGKQEFIAEVTTIGSLHHRNLVKLIGWCYEKKELLIVYEFMPQGSLDKYIFAEKKFGVGGEDLTLCWEKRRYIIFGIAQALDYLHNGCDKKVLHRDVKASNIMLDHDFSAKLADFGLARTIQQSDLTHHSTNAIAGTPGYMAPETMLVGRATDQTDVYAFGVLVLEVVCGRKPGNQREDDDYNNSIVYWLWNLRSKNRILEAVDHKLKGEFEREEMECVMTLGLACCHPNPHKRPSMKVALQVLTGEADPPDLPMERPAFVWPAMPPSFSKECDHSLTGGQITPFTQLSGR